MLSHLLDDIRQWKKTKLNFAELQDSIKISGQFDVYLSKLNSDVT